MANMIASLTDGRVVPWFPKEDPVPQGYVVVPPSFLAKFAAGEIADGVALAKAALAADAEVGIAPLNAAPIPPPPPPKKGDTEPQKGEPSFPSVTHFPTQGKTIRV